jgi:hypothetical protein
MIVLVVGFSATVARSAAQSAKDYVAVDNPRPLAKAIEVLERRYGWIVTYEDPRVENSADLEDVTAAVRNSPGPRVLIPKGSAFTFVYDKPILENNAQAGPILAALLTTYSTSGNPGEFRLLTSGNVYHVVPHAVRNRAGQVVAQESVLDSRISLRMKDQSIEDVVTQILAAVSDQAGVRLQHGATPRNLLLQTRVDVEASREPARDVLVRVLAAAPRPLSWRLFFDPGLRIYAFNVHFAHNGPTAR